MEKCIADLYSAVTQISVRYFGAVGTREDHTQYNQQTEQSFTAELFHRFKSIMEQPINQEYYDNLFLNFDIGKQAFGIRPDLVLHNDQGNRDNQKVFIEVKTDPDANLTDDFTKLIRASTEFGFHNSVLIVVNKTFQETLEAMKNHYPFFALDGRIKKKIFIINVKAVENEEIDYSLYSVKYLGDNN